MHRVFAQVPISGVFSPADKFPTLGTLVSIIVKNAFVLAGIITFVLLVFGGISFIMGAGSGDAKQADKGKQAITGAVTGLLIIVCSFWVIQILERLTGLSLITPVVP